MRLSRGPVDHPDNTYKQKQNAYKSRCGCERVKPNNSSDRDTDLDEWLKEIKHLSSSLLVRIESRDGNKDRLQTLLHIVASATQRGVGVGGGGGTHGSIPWRGRDQEMKVWKLMSMYNTAFCGMQQAQSVIRYPLLLGGNECLEAWGNPEAQLVEERRLWLSVKLYLYAGLIGHLI